MEAGLDLEARLDAAEKRKAARRAAEELDAKAQRLALLELEEKLEEKLGGRAGEVFTVLDLGPDGPLAFRLGEAVLFKSFNAEIDKNKEKRGGDGITPEACQRFLTPLLVYPEDKLSFFAICERRHGVLLRAAGQVMSLYLGKKAEEDAKR